MSNAADATTNTVHFQCAARHLCGTIVGTHLPCHRFKDHAGAHDSFEQFLGEMRTSQSALMVSSDDDDDDDGAEDCIEHAVTAAEPLPA